MKTTKNDRTQAESPVFTARAAADYLGLGLRTLRMLSEAGKLPCLRLSPRRIGYLRADLDAYIAQQRS